MVSADETASRLVRPVSAQPAAAGTAYLLVVEDDRSTIVHLPRDGTVVIGRGTEAQVKLTHASVSRRHAMIRVEDTGLYIADLESHNGTRVNGALVQESRSLSSGDVASVGDVKMVLHVSTPVVSRATHNETGWRRRLVEEIERATTYHRSLAVLAIAGIDPVTMKSLVGVLRMIDVVGEPSGGHALVLMPEADRAQAHAIAEATVAAARATQPGIKAGLAMCPSDACDANTILLAARSAADRAAPGTVAEVSDAAVEKQLGTRRVVIADPAMHEAYDRLERLARSNVSVLITGETGVGKDNAAFAVHHFSGRTGPFIARNCGGLAPDGLVESELFGHDKGAFTGAVSARPGLFESADGGTVFLDEIGDLPLGVQVKLLRTLDNNTVIRVGETRERPVNVRLVAATHKDLDAEVAAGRFRQDLLYRVRRASVILPPLRDRRCEIATLARTFLAATCGTAKSFTPDAMQLLLTSPWPGNVRQLKNVVEGAAALAPDEHVEASDVQEALIMSGMTGSTPPQEQPVSVSSPAAPEPDVPVTFRPIAEELRDLEKRRMIEALAAAGGVRTRAAQLIEMPIRTFTLKLKQYGLK